LEQNRILFFKKFTIGRRFKCSKKPSIATAKQIAIALGYPGFFFVHHVFNDELRREGINAHIDLKAR
jgi:hypothetical protein